MKNPTIMGAICGDICGSIYEHGPYPSNGLYEITSASKFTDDTVMTIAVADWLLNTDQSQKAIVEKLREWGREYIYAGYGKRFYEWLISDDPQPYNSWGNGGAMRTSACGWYANSITDAEELALIQSVTTHDHVDGYTGAMSIAGSIFMAKTGASKEEIRKYNESLGYYLDFDSYDIILSDEYHFDTAAAMTVPPALVAFFDSNNYDECMMTAVGMHGDADTLMCMSGAISAAFYHEIPDWIYEPCYEKLTGEMQDIVEQFDNYINNKHE